MSESRKRIVDLAFKKMDKTGDGFITMADLKRLYNVKASSRYQAGEDSEASLLQTFLDHFEADATHDGRVSSNVDYLKKKKQLFTVKNKISVFIR